ncbi:MAG: HlyC/CorC family transporter [Flavobacteriales bacterium]|nr:HlyC/CorC family transporter [Flavobacteriales bacterium]MCB9204779.1 HlyC/CorC family transporter [Flavobacteriales bacterium]
MTYTIIIAVCLLLSAFFSGMEIAFVSANRFKVEVDRKKGTLSASIIGQFLEKPSQFISALLVGNNIALVVYGITMAKLLEPGIRNFTSQESYILVIQTIISTLIILVTAEFLPKAFFRINPNRMLDLFAIPAKVVYTLLYPLVWLIDRFSQKVLSSLFKIRLAEEQLTFGRSDLDEYVNEFTAKEEEEDVDSEIQIFRNALNFSEIKVRECMIPRVEIIAMSIEDDIDDLKQKLIDTGLSKILIYRDDIDNIIGYVHSFELFQKPKAIKNIIRPISLVPESTKVKDLLKQFGQQHRSVAVVLNEFGGTAGMITVEDIVEEIFGDIEDEHDKEDLIDEKISDSEYRFSGRLDIDYINQNYGLKLPESDDYETLGGFIFEHHQSIPEVNEKIMIGDFLFTITKMESTRIEEVRLVVDN